MRVGVGRLSAPTRPSSSQRFSMNLWLPSPWIAPSFGRTDHSPLQTARESFDLKQLSSDLDRNMALPWPFTVQCLVTRATGDQGLPAVRYHTLNPMVVVVCHVLV